MFLILIRKVLFIVKRGIFLLVIATVLWGGNYICGRFLAHALPSMLLNTLRWALILKERVKSLSWIGAALSIAGVIVLFQGKSSGDTHGSMAGNLEILLSCIGPGCTPCWANGSANGRTR